MQENSPLAMEWHKRLEPKKVNAKEPPATVIEERSFAINLFVNTFPQLAASVPDQVLMRLTVEKC